MRNNRYTIKSILFLVAGILLLLAAAGAGVATQRFVHRARQAAGMVVRQNAGPSHVEIQFTTERGEIVNYPQTGLIYLNHGQAVTVLYDPANPRGTASISNKIALWDCTMGLLLPGLVLTLIGVRFFRRRV